MSIIDHRSLETLTGCRDAYIQREGPTEEGEELEVLWISELLKNRQAMLRNLGLTYREMEDQRKTVRGVRSTAVGLLERKANDLEQIRGMLSDLGPEVSDDFKCQIETAEELVLNISQELEKGNRPMRNHPTKKKRQGNRPHFPGLVIREFWPVLRKLNYEISAGSRILASAMIKSGWVDRDHKKTSKSLYQLIRDFESRS